MNIYQMIRELRYTDSLYKTDSSTYKMLAWACDRYFRSKNQTNENNHDVQEQWYEYGGLNIKFPYRSLGNVDSVNALSLFELFLFNFYKNNPFSYKRVLDLGANLGLHTLVLAKSGMNVTCYEPDPMVFDKLSENIRINMLKDCVTAVNRAVTPLGGEVEFVRVLDNLTGSHISGFKDSYGPREVFRVQSDSFGMLLKSFDFCKLDVEGLEAELILSTLSSDWDNTDAFVELDGTRNDDIFNHLSLSGVNMYSQKNCFFKVESPDQLPVTYREGNVFISKKNLSDIRSFF